MSLRVETSNIDPDIVVFRLSGGLTLSPETDSLESLVRERVQRGDKKLIFELSGVERIDSVGGMVLVRCFFAAREAGAGLCLAGVSHAVERLFRSTHVDTLIPFFPSTAAATEHLRAGPGTKG